MPRPNDPTLPESYVYRFELGGRPFYVGLGRAKRASDRLRYVRRLMEREELGMPVEWDLSCAVLAGLLRENHAIDLVYAQTGLTRAEAKVVERQEIERLVAEGFVLANQQHNPKRLGSAEEVIRAVLASKGPRPVNDKPVQIIGRTGSLFTRLPRIFAEELGVAYELVRVEDLASMEPSAYAGNPALRMPALRDGDAVLFGAQNVCRAIVERAAAPARIVWPEDLRDVLSRNAQELVSHAMAAQVQLLMGMDIGELPSENVFFVKARAGLEGALGWLEAHLEEVLSALPEPRSLSFFEVSLFCLIEHLEFASTVPIEPHRSLLAFARRFGARPSAQRTAFR